MLLWPVLRRGAGGASVNTLEATQLINRQDALVLDVRNPEEFAEGTHPERAQHPAAQLDARVRHRPLQGEAGHRGLRIRQPLGAAAAGCASRGFSQVFNTERRYLGVAAGGPASGEIARMPKVLMYATGSCPFCVRAQMLLKAKGVTDIEKIRVDLDLQQREVMMQKTGRRTVPQIFIGGTYVGGYDDLAALDRAGKLDPLLAA